jgi:hypothetical protein
MAATFIWGLTPVSFLLGYLLGLRASRKREAAIVAGLSKVMADYTRSAPPQEP